MKPILEQIAAQKNKALPILSFPAVSLTGATVRELITDKEKQIEGVLSIIDRCPVSAAVYPMDLSVEAEAFGAELIYKESDLPTVKSIRVANDAQARNLRMPLVGMRRTETFIEGVMEAKVRLGNDVPLFCSVTGPFTLAARLCRMEDLILWCADDDEGANNMIAVGCDFLIRYAEAFKAVGADGIIIAEPAAGLLSPSLLEQFSSRHVRRIIKAVSDDRFAVVYHNCAGSVVHMADNIASLGADAYHFGNAVDMRAMLEKMPSDAVVMGNIDPLAFCDETPEKVYGITTDLMKDCSLYKNFLISSGCDIPARAKWENLDAFFKAVSDFYA